jgi:phosphoglycerate dehydrogenase-like enzyme
LTDAGNELIIYDKTDDINLQKERVADADILVIANMPLKGEVIRAAKNLKYLSIAFTGFESCELRGL